MKEELVWEMYQKCGLGSNDYCEKCKENNKLGLPVGLWQYGEEFDDSEYKVMFVGKTAITDEKDDIPTDLERYERYAKVGDELFAKNYSAYWSYVKEITEELYGKDSWEKIAFSNLIKCNNASTNDETDDTAKKFCCEKNKILLKEIEIIKPNSVIFMVGIDYIENIKEMFQDSNNFSCNEVEMICVGNKKMPYWIFSLNDSNGKNIKCLVIGHPQYKNKQDYVRIVVDFIKNK